LVRERVSVLLPKKCVTWIDTKVEDGVFVSRSHAIETLILEAMKPTGRVSLTVDSSKASKMHEKEQKE
jgi:Arc/MetJ-type ribon-helix-helix transcriptional regulator